MKKIKLSLPRETIRDLTATEIRIIRGADNVVTATELESIVYWCPNNTSIQRSCSSCG